MKQFLSRVFTFFYVWNFKKSSYSKKREKVRKSEKYRPKKLPITPKKELIVFKDDKGIVCLSLLPENLFYIESDTNYITIYYSNQEKMEKYLMRSSLKMVLEQNNNDILVRCHRSYIVNFDKVKLYKKEKEGGILELANDSLKPISVSKSYLENVLQRFQF